MSKKIDRSRRHLFLALVYLSFFVIIIRLFYWQIIRGLDLSNQSENQSLRSREQRGLRGEIYTSDGYLLVGNQEVYDLKLDRRAFEGDQEELSQKLAAIIAPENWQYQDASESAIKEEIEVAISERLISKFSSRANWPRLAGDLSLNLKEKIEELNNEHLAFDTHFTRFYPEASMAAHLTGFLGKDENGNNIGRYGVEGALNEELSPRQESGIFHTDAIGNLLAGEDFQLKNLDGRDLTLTIRRDLQHLAQEQLNWGIEHYQAERGEIIIMESQTGKILAWATSPTYQQWQYFKYPAEVLKNPSLTRLYEPGSTFKILTVAAGIDAGVIAPETSCTSCAGPRQLANYQIKTWNDEYHPNITMTEALEKSDNVAMIFITDLLGKDRFINYLERFGIGQELNLDLQDDSSTYFPNKIGPVELATMAFGQGISTNSLQLLRAVNVIAHDGQMLEPMILEKVYDHQCEEEIITEIKAGEQVVSSESAAIVKEMMVASAAHGEAQWIASRLYSVAAKTGTSQVPDPNGGYSEDETIASFIGFAPASNPKFTMIVKLEHPQSSPWAAETAAPLWYRVADRLMLLLNISPDL